MILLTAIRLDAYDRFQFKIEGTIIPLAVTNDALQAAEMLLTLGVSDPERLVAHACTWGQVEIYKRKEPIQLNGTSPETK